MSVVYDGGRQEHLTTAEVARALRALAPGEIISDAVAQTIAAWWHSPAEPSTTLLSTRGIVTDSTSLERFGHWSDAPTEFQREALEELRAYILDRLGGGPRYRWIVRVGTEFCGRFTSLRAMTDHLDRREPDGPDLGTVYEHDEGRWADTLRFREVGNPMEFPDHYVRRNSRTNRWSVSGRT